jgi:hypothetical protein
MADSPVVAALTKPIVLWIGGGLLAVAIGLDIWLAVDAVPGNTWSELFRAGALATPVVPWACAVLMGHWFHPKDDFKALLGQPDSIALLVWLTWVLFVIGLALASSGLPISPWIPVLPGLIAGWLLWPV